MPLYEHVLIARQDLSNTQAEGLIEHFSTVLADNGGKVVENEYWGVRTLAYKINKNRKGHYAFLRTDAPSAAGQDMERLALLQHFVGVGYLADPAHIADVQQTVDTFFDFDEGTVVGEIANHT